MKPNSQHKKGCLAFLKAWHLIILELEKVKDSPVSDDDKCSWIVKSLMTHEVMYRVCTDASNLEHTMVNLNKSETTHTSELTKKLPFHAFYDMLRTSCLPSRPKESSCP